MFISDLPLALMYDLSYIMHIKVVERFDTLMKRFAAKAAERESEMATKKTTKSAKATKPKASKPKADASKPKAVAKATTKTKAVAFANPYRVGGGYWASVEALRTLGMGKMHPQAAIIGAVVKAYGEGWKAFADKPQRNDETAKDAEGRVWQNVSVVARKDYGEPLRKVGFEVRFDGRQKVAGLFRL